MSGLPFSKLEQQLFEYEKKLNEQLKKTQKFKRKVEKQICAYRQFMKEAQALMAEADADSYAQFEQIYKHAKEELDDLLSIQKEAIEREEEVLAEQKVLLEKKQQLQNQISKLEEHKELLEKLAHQSLVKKEYQNFLYSRSLGISRNIKPETVYGKSLAKKKKSKTKKKK
jgi:dsDNA-specific endonuclease/ATPase MutS2